jgi:hypothetical protein
MRSPIKLSLIIFLIFSFPLFSKPCQAEEKSHGCLQGIEYFSGFAQAKLRAKGSYNTSPFIVNFDFDLKPLTQKIGLNSARLIQFQLESFINPVYQPDSNVEIGNSFLLKIGLLPDNFKFQPYLKGGAGMGYITQHTQEQSTQFNFVEYAGLGLHYFFSKNTAFSMEGRYRHLSNADIKSPNSGINSYFILVGLSYLF